MRLDLANLFRHNNEHIVVIPKLIYAANYLATSGSNTGLIIYSLAVGIACTGLLLVLARETLRDTPWQADALRAAVPLGDVQRQADPQLFSRHERDDLAHRRSLRHHERRGSCPCRRH